jgi:uncharacterized protein
MNAEITDSQIFDRLGILPQQLVAFCQHHHILELSLFGSVLRDDFSPNSDIDVLVVFDPDPQFRISLLDLVGMEYELEDLFGREVDLVEKRAVESDDNWIRRKEILNTTQVIYESGSLLSARSSQILTNHSESN